MTIKFFAVLMRFLSSSNTLSGNRANPVKNSAGKDDKNHAIVYRLEDVMEHPEIGLKRGGLILIGLLSGGDYHQAGLERCGTKIAHGLAKCGFGDSLYHAAITLSRNELDDFIINWREELCSELATNRQGHLGRKHTALAKSVPDDFPDVDVLLSYTSPITSETQGKSQANLRLVWGKEPDLGKLASVCELYFEWGVKETIVKRFRTVIWPPIILRMLRRRVLDLESRPSPPIENSDPPSGTPSKIIAKGISSMKLAGPSNMVETDDAIDQLIIKVHSTRTHASTDELLEYRLEIAPAALVRLCEAGIKGLRPPLADDEWASSDDEHDGKSQKTPCNPSDHLRTWVPASIVRLACQDLVSDYEQVQERKRDKSAGKKKPIKSKGTIGYGATEVARSSKVKSTAAKKLGVVSRSATSKLQTVLVLREDEHLSCESDSLSDGASVTLPKVNAAASRSAKPQRADGSTALNGDPLVRDVKSFFTVGKAIGISKRPVVSEELTNSVFSTSPVDPFLEVIDAESSSSKIDIIHLRSKSSAEMFQSTGLGSDAQASSSSSSSSLASRLEPFPLTFKRDIPAVESSSTSDQKHFPRSGLIRKLGYSEDETDEDAGPSRLCSPSPRAHRPKPTTSKSTCVIEISSDSDGSPLKAKTKPLLAAQGSPRKRRGVVSRNPHKSPTKEGGRRIDNDIIDLT
jgi:holliday junction resolvase YEN1